MLLLVTLSVPLGPAAGTTVVERAAAAPCSGTGCASRMAIVILITDFEYKGQAHARLDRLRSAITLLGLHWSPYTPTDVFVFTVPLHVAAVRRVVAAPPHGSHTIEVHALEDRTWLVPDHVGNSSLWHGAWDSKYRLMGDWRMTEQMAFARRRGYRYVMQMDDDSFILGPVGRDMVAELDVAGAVMAARGTGPDPVLVLWGLAELARYFIMTEKLRPAGPLYEFCTPPSLQGLYTPLGGAVGVLPPEQVRAAGLYTPLGWAGLYTPLGGAVGVLSPKQLEVLREAGAQEAGGWNGTVPSGNMVIMSLDFWYSPEVQRFVHLCRSSGGSWRYRWNEQGVFAMVWQIFVPEQQFVRLDFLYRHKGGSPHKLVEELLRAAAAAKGGSSRDSGVGVGSKGGGDAEG